jgi:hypothetical protein
MSRRIISNDRLPDPTMTAARNSVTAAPVARSASPVSWGLRQCLDDPVRRSPRPPR